MHMTGMKIILSVKLMSKCLCLPFGKEKNKSKQDKTQKSSNNIIVGGKSYRTCTYNITFFKS